VSGRAQTLLALANAGRPIRPSGARNPTKSDPFESMQTAKLLLAPLGYGAVREEDLPGLRRLAELVREIAERTVDGKPSKEEVSDLNAYSRRSHGWLSLVSGDRGVFRTEMVWEDGLLEGDLARQIVWELGGIDSDRLKRCARPECGHIFYDETRPGTKRWHAENPCGWRERQARRRGHV
jgi:predicted RNA-binding Zn ribbon-like protein